MKFLGIVILSLVLFISIRPKEKYEGVEKLEIPNYKSSRLTVHFFSSPHGVDWSTPRSLLYSNLINFSTSRLRKMGHMAAEVQCISDEGTTEYYEFTGMSSDNLSSWKNIFIKKIGFGVIFEKFPGYLEDKYVLQEELKLKRKTGEVQSLTYLISKNNCNNLKKFIEEYRNSGSDKLYGGLNYKVREKQGAGCMHFAYSLLDIAGLINHSFIKDWNTEIRIPRSLIGNKKKPVSIFKLLTHHSSKSWSDSSENYEKIEFWDIDKIFNLLSKNRSIAVENKKRHYSSNEYLFDERANTDFQTNFWY